MISRGLITCQSRTREGSICRIQVRLYASPMRCEFPCHGTAHRIGEAHRAGPAEMNGGGAIVIYLSPAIEMVEQFRRGALRAQQCRVDSIVIQHGEKLIR